MLVKMMLIPKAEFNHAVHGLKCSLLTKTVSAFGMPVRLVAIAYKDRSEYFKEKELNTPHSNRKGVYERR